MVFFERVWVHLKLALRAIFTYGGRGAGLGMGDNDAIQEIIETMPQEGNELYDPEVAMAVTGKAKPPTKTDLEAPTEKKAKASMQC